MLPGEVVGVNSAIFSQSGGNVGIGFAIPIDLAKKIVDQLKKNSQGRARLVGHPCPRRFTAACRVIGAHTESGRDGRGHGSGGGKSRG